MSKTTTNQPSTAAAPAAKIALPDTVIAEHVSRLDYFEEEFAKLLQNIETDSRVDLSAIKTSFGGLLTKIKSHL